MTIKPILVLSWLLITSFVGALYLTLMTSPDQALFDYIAWSHLQGDHYYTGAAEQNWPGKMFIHELGIRLFGVHFWTFRAIDFLLMLVVTGGGWVLLSRSGFRYGATAFLFLYPALYVTAGSWMAGQRDIVAAGILVIAVSLASKSVSDQRFWRLFSIGMLVAVAVLIRPTYLSFLAGLLLLIWVRFPGEAVLSYLAKIRSSAIVICGFAAPILVVLIAGFLAGAIDDFYEQTILFNLQAYQVPGSRFRLIGQVVSLAAGSWHWISFLAMLGLLLWITRSGLTRPLLLMLGIVATILLSYFTQNKGFVYHLGGLLTVLVLLVAVAIDQLIVLRSQAQLTSLRVGLNAAICVAIVLCVAGTVKKLTSYDLESAVESFSEGALLPQIDDQEWSDLNETLELIRAETSSEDFILQWGREFHIPYLSERRSSIRYVSTPALTVMTPSFTPYEDWLLEVDQSLNANPPKIAVVDRESVVLASGGSRIMPLTDAHPAERMVINHLSQYEVALETSDYFVLRRL